MKQQPLLEGEAPKQDALERPNNFFDLFQLAIREKSAIDVIERLAVLQEKAQNRESEVRFNEAMAACQEEIKTVINDSDKTGPGGKKWATYRALDKEVRPIYLKNGFSISFGSADYSVPEMILCTCHVSHKAGHTRLYQLPMDASGKGAQGGGALSRPHAILAATEYGRRCLLKLIFNIVTGDEEKHLVPTSVLADEIVVQRVDSIKAARNGAELGEFYRAATEEAAKAGDQNAPTHYWNAVVDARCGLIVAALDMAEMAKEYAAAANEALDQADKSAINKYKGARNRRRGELEHASH